MICLDANIVIEIILKREKSQACRRYMNSAKEDIAITLLSMDLVMYYSEKNKLKLLSIEQFLRLFVWLPMTDSDANWAFRHFANCDFEDALQIACAIREGCSKFVTLDKSLAKKYSQNISTYLVA